MGDHLAPPFDARVIFQTRGDWYDYWIVTSPAPLSFARRTFYASKYRGEIAFLLFLNIIIAQKKAGIDAGISNETRVCLSEHDCKRTG